MRQAVGREVRGIARSLARDLRKAKYNDRVDLSLASSSAPGVQKMLLKDTAACCVFFNFPSIHFKFQISKNKIRVIKQAAEQQNKQLVAAPPNAPPARARRRPKQERQGVDCGTGVGCGQVNGGWCRMGCDRRARVVVARSVSLLFWRFISSTDREHIGTPPQKAPGSRTAVAHRPCAASVSGGNGSLAYLLCSRWSLVCSLLRDVLSCTATSTVELI